MKPPPYRRDSWSVGIYAGPSPLELSDAPGVCNPVLGPSDITDRRATLVADPFLARYAGDGWQMFVEVEAKRGEVGLATSPDGLNWTYQGIVLSEPFHLSYPQVFQWEDEIYLVPESHQDESVRLYRAVSYPHRWEYVGNLLEGEAFSDPTLFFHEDRWWMWVEITDFKFDTVHLFWASDLTGPWHPHPQSPVVHGDPRRARPGGSVRVVDGRVFRFVQDCVPAYGTKSRVMEVTTLTPTQYEETEAPQSPVCEGSGKGWNATGMHHVDAHLLEDGSWLAAVDGWIDLEADREADGPPADAVYP